MQKEIDIFTRHAQENGLKHSLKRDQILKSFLSADRHVSAEDLFEIVKKENPTIGYTTVYRTLKLIVESGLAEMVDFNDGVRRYECKIGREYHAHFICTKCSNTFEVFDQNIENLSARLAKAKGFQPQKHRMEIFGICKDCTS